MPRNRLTLLLLTRLLLQLSNYLNRIIVSNLGWLVKCVRVCCCCCSLFGSHQWIPYDSQRRAANHDPEWWIVPLCKTLWNSYECRPTTVEVAQPTDTCDLGKAPFPQFPYQANVWNRFKVCSCLPQNHMYSSPQPTHLFVPWQPVKSAT